MEIPSYFYLRALGFVVEIYRSDCGWLCFGIRTRGNKWHSVGILPIGPCKDPDCEDHRG